MVYGTVPATDPSAQADITFTQPRFQSPQRGRTGAQPHTTSYNLGEVTSGREASRGPATAPEIARA